MKARSHLKSHKHSASSSGCLTSWLLSLISPGSVLDKSFAHESFSQVLVPGDCRFMMWEHGVGTGGITLWWNIVAGG